VTGVAFLLEVCSESSRSMRAETSVSNISSSCVEIGIQRRWDGIGDRDERIFVSSRCSSIGGRPDVGGGITKLESSFGMKFTDTLC
jgi:hypothetical protein